MLEAKTKVADFKKALRGKNYKKIKKIALEIQADPAAIKEINTQQTSVKKVFTNTVEKIQKETIQNIQKKYAAEYNKKHPNNKIQPEDVSVEKFTNPSKEVKAGHDWDVTVTVKGKEVHYKESRKIVNESFFEAAGGKKVYPNSNAETFAEHHHVEVTSSHHAEAYEGGKEYIQNPSEYNLKDSERLSKTIEHKSILERNKAQDYAKSGNTGSSEIYKGEEIRQYTKQYEKHIKPIVEKNGGKIPENIKQGTEIMKKVGKYDEGLGRVYTPQDANVDLAKIGKHGETVESIIKKGSGLVESSEKLKSKIAIKENTETVPEKLKTKGKLGKAVDTISTGAVIFNTAEDIKQSLLGKKPWKETGENAVDAATMGALSTTKQVITKNKAFSDVVRLQKQAQNSEDEALIQQRGVELAKNGVSIKETKKIMNDMRNGSLKSYIKKVGELRKNGKKIALSTGKYVELENPDDTYTERAKNTFKEIGKGLYDYGKRAGNFVIQTGKDLNTIAKDNMNIDSLNKKTKAEKSANAKIVEQKLIRKGLSPEAAKIVVDRYKEGDNKLLKYVIKHFQKKQKAKKKINKIRTVLAKNINKNRNKKQKTTKIAKAQKHRKYKPIQRIKNKSVSKATKKCYERYSKIVQRAIKSNSSNDPSGNIAIVTLDANRICTTAFKKCSDNAWELGHKCRMAGRIQSQCNRIYSTASIKCAIQENRCSAGFFKKQCDKLSH